MPPREFIYKTFFTFCEIFFLVLTFGTSNLLGQSPPVQIEKGISPKAIVDIALRNNPGLAARDLETKISSDLVTQAKAEFDPEFFFDVSYGKRQMTQNTKDFFAAGGDPNTQLLRFFEEEGLRMLMGLGGKFPIGLMYSLEIRVNQLENNIIKDNAYNIFLPEVESFYGLRLTQPLLRGRNRDANLAEVSSAKHGAQIGKAELAAARMMLAGDVLTTYADLVWHTRESRIRMEQAERLDKEVTRVEIQVERGEESKEALIAIKRETNNARDQFFLADLRRQKTNFILRSLAGQNNLKEQWLPKESLLPSPELDRSSIVRQALVHHPRLVGARFAYEREDALVAGARNDKYPNLDLDLSIGYLGLNDNVSSSAKAVFESGRPEFGAGLRFSYDLDNRKARGALTEALARRRQASLSLDRARRRLISEIRQGFSEWEAAKVRTKHANSGLATAATEYEAEKDRLEKGLAKPADSLPAFIEVMRAKSRLFEEENIRDKALTRLLAAAGIILEYL